MSPNGVDIHVNEILKYQSQLKRVPDEQYIMKIEILTKILVLSGKLASHFSGEYKRIYAERKRVHAETYLNATRNKKEVAELSIVSLREDEAEAYENMKRWNLGFESTREEINTIKYRIKIDIADGSSNKY